MQDDNNAVDNGGDEKIASIRHQKSKRIDEVYPFRERIASDPIR